MQSGPALTWCQCGIIETRSHCFSRGCWILCNLECSSAATQWWIWSLSLQWGNQGLTLFWSVQVSAHFLSKQARKTVAAGASLETHTVQQALQWRKEKRILQLNKTPFFLSYIITTGRHSACCRSRKDQQRINTSCSCGSFFFADKFRSFSREL